VRRRTIVVLLVLAAVAAPAARADGDPASDFLVGQNVFFGLTQPPHPANAELQAAVGAAYAHGLRVRVAVIGSQADLGSVPSLYGKPASYAKFLGIEIKSYYVGPLLVVMPAGFGIYDGGRSTEAEASVLARRPTPGRTRAELTLSAARAVHDLRVAGALRSKDILAPSASTFSGSASTGDSMKLRYAVADDSGRASVELRVLAGKRRLAKIDVPMRRVDGSKTYVVRWRVTSGLVTTAARLCITARDPAGNRSARFCTPIELQPSVP
jgi:hypothetical protein